MSCSYIKYLSREEIRKFSAVVIPEFMDPLKSFDNNSCCTNCQQKSLSMECRKQVMFQFIKKVTCNNYNLVIDTPYGFPQNDFIANIQELTKLLGFTFVVLNLEVLLKELNTASKNERLEFYLASYSMIEVLILHNLGGQLLNNKEVDLFKSFVSKRLNHKGTIFLYEIVTMPKAKINSMYQTNFSVIIKDIRKRSLEIELK